MDHFEGYGYLVADTPAGLCTKVREAMKDAWQPVGGMVIDTSASPTQFYQTMIRRY